MKEGAMRSVLIGLAFALMPAIAPAADAGDPCDGASTPEINACFAGKLEAAEAQMQRYLRAAVLRHQDSGDPGIALGMESSQEAFEAYRDIACRAVYYRWRDGTIRGLHELTCRIALTDQRTHVIWAQWLTYPDGTSPTLPEPTKTE